MDIGIGPHDAVEHQRKRDRVNIAARREPDNVGAVRAMKHIVDFRPAARAADRSYFGHIPHADHDSAGTITPDPRLIAAHQPAFDHIDQPFPEIAVMGYHAPRVKRLGQQHG